MRKIKDFLRANIDRKVLIVPVGFPGSGKSTLFKELSKDFDIEKVSFDDIRIEYYRKKHPFDNRNDREIYKDAFLLSKKDKLNLKKVAREKIKQSDKRIIYLDNTNLTKKSRRTFLLECNDFVKVGVFFDVPLDVCIQRQFVPYRDKFVSPKVIKQLSEVLQPPEIDEFNVVFKIKNGSV